MTRASVPDAYEFTTRLWVWEGEAPWCFVTVPDEVSDEIEFRAGGRPRRGFGSVRVEAIVGTTTWRTSLFPDARRGAYLLPVKKEVRRREALQVGDDVTTRLELVES